MIKSYGSAARFNIRFGNPHSKFTSVLLGISVILVSHTRFKGHLGAPANIFQTLKSCYVRNMFFFGNKNEKAAGNRSYIFCPCSTRLLPITYKLT